MTISSFSLITNRKRIFQPGSVMQLSDEVLACGRNTVLFTGGSSLKKSGILAKISQSFDDKGLNYIIFNVKSEPSPDLVDKITEELRGNEINSIAAVGGGSVIDTAKAVSAMLCEEGNVCDFLEGIGDKTPSGRKIPFIAVPTTAGTGAEATYNSVLSRVGSDGFKKSLRHLNYIPDTAIIDPELYYGCPVDIASSSGMDALAQLVESYLSTKATFYTDILVQGAIEGMLEALPVVTSDKKNEEYFDSDCEAAWFKMAYGAYISGLALANCGYCIVHGMAGAVGGFFDIPHGTVCGTLLATGIKHTIERLEKNNPDAPAMLKTAKLGYIAAKSDDLLPREARARFIQVLDVMTESMEIKKLSAFGVTEASLEKIAAASSNKNSPVIFSKEDIIDILKSRL